MGCTITSEKKVIPSIRERKKKEAVSLPTINIQEVPKSTYEVHSLDNIPKPNSGPINPSVIQLQPTSGKKPKLNLNLNKDVNKDCPPKVNRISPIIPEGSKSSKGLKVFFPNAGICNEKTDCKGKTSFSDDVSSKKPLASTFTSVGRMCSSAASIDLSDNSHAVKYHTAQPSTQDRSNLLTTVKCESLKSIPAQLGKEERPSLEEIGLTASKKENGKNIPSLGLIEAVEEVNVSTEIHVKNIEEEKREEDKEKKWEVFGKEHCLMDERMPNESACGVGNKEVYLTFCAFPTPESLIKNVSRHIMHPAHAEEAKTVNTEAVKTEAKEETKLNIEPVENNTSPHCAPKSPLQEEKLKQMKAKFTRNLIQLVAQKRESSPSDKENFDPKPALPITHCRQITDRDRSLSLIYCAPDDVENQKPNLDARMLAIFEDAEGFSPIHPPARPAFEDLTPLASVENSTHKRKIAESSTLLEDQTISNLQDNLSESDIDKYSFVAEVKEIEIDEKNNFNIYKGQKMVIHEPHPVVQKSAFVSRAIVYSRAMTLDAKPKVHRDLERSLVKSAQIDSGGQLRFDKL